MTQKDSLTEDIYERPLVMPSFTRELSETFSQFNNILPSLSFLNGNKLEQLISKNHKQCNKQLNDDKKNQLPSHIDEMQNHFDQMLSLIQELQAENKAKDEQIKQMKAGRNENEKSLDICKKLTSKLKDDCKEKESN